MSIFPEVNKMCSCAAALATFKIGTVDYKRSMRRKCMPTHKETKTWDRIGGNDGIKGICSLTQGVHMTILL